MLALMTGMRPKEYLALQWQDIDFERSVVTFGGRSSGDARAEAGTLKSRKRPAAVAQPPLTPSLLLELAQHKRQQAEERFKVGPAYQKP